MDTPNWRKSTFSFANNNCVETADSGDSVLIRDTKDNGTGPVLAFGPAAWREFTARLSGS